MNAVNKAQSLYYQTIAREFFRRRGAPFHLSPRDVELIARWESLRVPLDIILEGMDRAFENYRKGGRPLKAMSLSFCEYQVMKSFGQHAERRAGEKRKSAAGKDKRSRVLREIERFLGETPAGLEDLRAPFLAALEILGREAPDEEALERLDEEIDEIVWKASPAEEKKKIRKEVLDEFRGKRDLDLQDVVRTRVVKARRDEGRIPYLGLFYY